MSIINENKLPDFDDMLSLAGQIKEVSLLKAQKELELEEVKAAIIKSVTSNMNYYINGKVPSMSYMEKTFLVTGLQGELTPIKVEIEKLKAELNYLKEKMAIFKLMIEVWRTEQANKRAATF